LYLWSVQRTNTSQPSWLFGTAHLPQELVPMKFQAEIAFKYSRELFVEMTTEDSESLDCPESTIKLDGTGEAIDLPEDILDDLDEDLKHSLQEIKQTDEYQELGIWDRVKIGLSLKVSHLEKFDPWTISDFLNGLPWFIKFFPEKETIILDRYLEERAKEEGKRVASGETAEEICKLLREKPQTDDDALYSLRSTLDDRKQARNTGQFTRLEKVVNDYNCLTLPLDFDYSHVSDDVEPDDHEYQDNVVQDTEEYDYSMWVAEELLGRRNYNMAERISSILSNSDNKTKMFAYGTNHFIGPHSVVTYLQKMGFIVTRIKENDNLEWLNQYHGSINAGNTAMHCNAELSFTCFIVLIFLIFS